MFKQSVLTFVVLLVHFSYEVSGENESSWEMRAEGRIDLGGTNYYFENIVQSNWYQAQEFCRAHNMQLLTIETREEDQLILDYLESIGDISNRWTSGSDFGVNNTYVWSSTGARVGYTNWHTDEPNHIIRPEGEEHVIEILPLLKGSQYEWKWNDVPALYQYYAVCEEVVPLYMDD